MRKVLAACPVHAPCLGVRCGPLRVSQPALTRLPLLPPPCPGQAAALVSCVPELQLDIYALKREERAFSMLAKAIKDTFAKHAEESVTLACVRALVHCAAEGPDTIRDAARLVLTQAGEEAAAKLAAAVRALVGAAAIELQAAVAAYEEDPEDEEELLFDTRAALVRLCALLQLEAGACSGDEVYDSLNQLVEVGLGWGGLGWKELAAGCAACCLPLCPGGRPSSIVSLPSCCPQQHCPS